MKKTIIIISFLLFSYASFAQQSFLTKGVGTDVHSDLQDIGIDENLGVQLNLDLTFTGHDGVEKKLRDFIRSDRPTLLTLIYYSCPSLCNFHLNGLNEVFKQLDWTVGEEFNLVAISINPEEGPEIAYNKRASYIKEYGREVSENSWHFLTGDQDSISEIAEQIGFKYKWVEDMQEYAHAAAAYVVTPDGKISRYLYGIGFSPEVLRLSLVEASQGTIGTIVDRFILYCFQYDPDKKTYAFYAFNLMRAGAGLTALILFLFLSTFWLRQRRTKG